jgi:hypothetical protein
MSASAISGPALLRATLLRTVLQTTMVVAGHFSAQRRPALRNPGHFSVAGGGSHYALWAAPAATRAGAVGGALAGGVCTLIGIATSVALGDVLAAVLGFGTRSSAVAGAVGGAAGAAIER